MTDVLKSALAKRAPSSQGWHWAQTPTATERAAFAALKKMVRRRPVTK